MKTEFGVGGSFWFESGSDPRILSSIRIGINGIREKLLGNLSSKASREWRRSRAHNAHSPAPVQDPLTQIADLPDTHVRSYVSSV